jgi:hypothetical protein
MAQTHSTELVNELDEGLGKWLPVLEHILERQLPSDDLNDEARPAQLTPVSFVRRCNMLDVRAKVRQ